MEETIPGFAVELLDTDLDDFIEHANFGVKVFSEWYCDLEGEHTLWSEYEVGPELERYATTYTRTKVGTIPKKGIEITIECFSSGRPYYMWSAYSWQIPEGMFALSAARYRRDRLSIVFLDQGGDQSRADRVLEWLRFHWRDAVHEPQAITEQEHKEIDDIVKESGKHRGGYKENDVKATMVYYLLDNYGGSLTSWCGQLDIKPATAKAYKDNEGERKLLTPEQFAKRLGESLEKAASRVKDGGSLI